MHALYNVLFIIKYYHFITICSIVHKRVSYYLLCPDNIICNHTIHCIEKGHIMVCLCMIVFQGLFINLMTLFEAIWYHPLRVMSNSNRDSIWGCLRPPSRPGVSRFLNSLSSGCKKWNNCKFPISITTFWFHLLSFLTGLSLSN